MHKHFVNRFVSVIAATTAVMWMSAVAFPSAQTEGVKETGQFVNTGADTSSAVGKARLQVQNTLAAYNALVTQPSKDMKGDFKKLLNGAKDTGERVDDARERVTKMEAAGEHATSPGAQPPSRGSRTQICEARGNSGSTRARRGMPACWRRSARRASRSRRCGPISTIRSRFLAAT